MFAEMGAEPLPVAIDGRRIPTDPIRHDARLVTAANFCATGTGIHDDTDALLAYLNWFRRQLSEPNPQRVWKLSDRSRYRVTKSLNFSGFTNVEFDGGRSQIYSSERDFPIIDALGTSDHVAMRQHHALGFARAARGVQDRGHVGVDRTPTG